jgi:hypothetical protein
MPEHAAPQGRAATEGGNRPSARPIPDRRASSKSTVIGVGVVGAVLTAAMIAGTVLMTGSPTTQVAMVSVPSAAAPPSVVPVRPPAPVTVAPAPDFVPLRPPVAAPPLALAIPAPAPNVPGQCRIGQLQQLTLGLSATLKKEFGNVIRIHSGSYVSEPIVLTKYIQTVTFPAPPGSTNSALIIVEQSKNTGSTFHDTDGIAAEFNSTIDDHRDYLTLHWNTPRC